MMTTFRMKGIGRRAWVCGVLFLAMAFAGYGNAFACTSVTVGSLASVDGSVMTSHTADGGFCDFRITRKPAADHKPGEMRQVYLNPTLRAPEDVRFEPLILKGEIPEVAHTYAYVSGVYGLQNEHQLSIGETTISGRRELQDPESMFDIVELSHLAMERCTTAREAVRLMGELAEMYGYCDYGECLTVADSREVWQFEIFGATPTVKSATWAAQRVPDDQICVSANRARIGEIDLKNKDYFMASKNVFSLAEEKGWYNPKSGAPFLYYAAYCPTTGYYNARREWRVFSLLAPSLNLDAWADRYPFSVKPDKKVSVESITSVLRDHYEGTPFDLTKGTAAGPFGTPNRYATQRSVSGTWERALSIFRCEYSFVSQSRSWLPDAVGGVLWFGWDAPHSTVYMPLYCGATALPASFSIGNRGEFNRKSANWAFAFVSNWADLRYNAMIVDIQAKYKAIESAEYVMQPAIEKTAAELYAKDKDLGAQYLTKYMIDNANSIVDQWWTFGDFLVGKYHDGYDNNPKIGMTIGYPEGWLKTVGYGPIQKP